MEVEEKDLPWMLKPQCPGIVDETPIRTQEEWEEIARNLSCLKKQAGGIYDE